MFIRQTKTRGSVKGDSYLTYRLVTSERVGSKVRQRTLLNLGSNFPLSKDKWPALCTCIERHQSGQDALVFESAEIEKLAAIYAGRLLAASPAQVSTSGDPVCDYQEVDTNSLELSRPRSVGVAHVGLSAMSWVAFEDILSSVGMTEERISSNPTHDIAESPTC